MVYIILAIVICCYVSFNESNLLSQINIFKMNACKMNRNGKILTNP